MILDWLKPKKIAAPTNVVLDVDKNALREYDDVALLRDTKTDHVPEELRFFRGVIPAGTVGTIIIIDSNLDQTSVHLEFNIGHQLAFAHCAGDCVRLERRREEKLRNA